MAPGNISTSKGAIGKRMRRMNESLEERNKRRAKHAERHRKRRAQFASIKFLLQIQTLALLKISFVRPH